MDLSDVKAAVAAYFPCYVDMLRWEQHGDIITATPKKPLGDQAFKLINKAFRKCGGHFARYKGTSYFELVVKEAEQSRLRRTHTYSHMCILSCQKSPLTPEPVFTRLQNQLNNLTETGKRLTE